MSLYTPVFPSLDEPNSLRNRLPENSSAATPGKQKSYVEFLRDLHLFLSTQNDTLSPPSRPTSPMFDRRVQKVRDEIKDVFGATGCETSNGKWTRVSQTLKLGCVRGRHWSVSKVDPCTPEEDTNWILPDAESEWIDWEKKREESRRLRRTTNTSPQTGNAAAAIPDSRKPNHGGFEGPIRSNAMARQPPPRGASPATMRAAKEKVRKWQASVAPEVWPGTTSGASPTSTRAAEGKTEMPQRSRTLDFVVVKPAVKSILDKRRKGPLSRPTARSGSAPTPSHNKPSKASDVPQVTAPIDVGSELSMKTSPAKNDVQTPFLPPSFPAHLATSTPLANSVVPIHTKPSLILPLPASSSMPPPLTPAGLPGDRQLISAEPHATNVSPSLPPRIGTSVQPGKRSRAVSTSSNGIPDNPLLTLPAKKVRTLSRNCSTSAPKQSGSMSPNGELDIRPSTRDDARDPSLCAAPSRRSDMISLEVVSGAPSTPGKNGRVVTDADAQGFPEKIPSPSKSVKSYFSAPDSDPADSPVKANLLLGSPISPMLSYARNPSGFLPQITSTQVGKGSSAVGRTNTGIFGMGYSSQFDVERHVDRVSELLEKDVDFDGWLRDVRIVETSQD